MNKTRTRKLIDLDNETIKALTCQAIDAGMRLKNYIELLLTSKAGEERRKYEPDSNIRIHKKRGN